MPKWIHERAMKLKGEMEKTYPPKKAKQVAFAVATQQAHATGQAPKKWKGKTFGTPEGKREAKAKFDEPKSEYKKTADALDPISLIRKMAEGGEVPVGDEGALRTVEQELRDAGDKESEVLDRLEGHSDPVVQTYAKLFKKQQKQEPLPAGGMHRVSKRLLSGLERPKVAQEGAGQAVPSQPTTPTTAPPPPVQPPAPNSPNMAASTPGMKTTVASLRAMQKKLAQEELPQDPGQRSVLAPALGGAALGAGIGGAGGYLMQPRMQAQAKSLLPKLPGLIERAPAGSLRRRFLGSNLLRKSLERSATQTAGKAALRGAATHAGVLGALGLGYGLLRNKQAQEMYAPSNSRNEARALERAYMEQTGNPSPTSEELEAWRQQKAQAVQDVQQVPVDLGPIPPAPQQLLTIPSREPQEGQIQAVESPEVSPVTQVQPAPAAAMPAVGAAPAPASPGPATTASFVPPEAGAFQIR